jgi:regulation of enolase protein 1 (concanavalin A-like superfamily)
MIQKIDPRTLNWISRPGLFFLNSKKITVETEPKTELSSRGREAEAVELALSPSGSFCFTCRVEYQFQKTFDQCGVILYLNDKRKAVVSTENRNEEMSRLSCIVFHGGKGDKSIRDIGSAMHEMYYRIWYRAGAVRIQFSFSGSRFDDLRKFWITPGEDDKLAVGIYACSPADSRFDCTFSNMTLEEDGELYER